MNATAWVRGVLPVVYDCLVSQFYLLEIVSYYCCASIPFSEVNLDTKSSKQAFQRSQNLLVLYK